MSETMPNWLLKRAQLTPDRIAIQLEDGKQYSFAQLHDQVVHKANQLMSLKLKKDDHVALLAGNSFAAVVCIHALQYIGAVAVLLNTRLQTEELAWQMTDAKVKCLITDQEQEQKATLAAQLMTNIKLVQLDDNEVVTKECPIVKEFGLSDVHTIIYTSGTTGNPKGVQLTYGNHLFSAIGSSLNLGLLPEDRWLCCLPIFHVSGLSILIRSVIYGMPVIFHQTFNPDKIVDSLRANQVTIISVVAVQLQQILQCLTDTPESLRCVLLGGGPAPKPLLQKCQEKQIPVYQTYGMTETASQIVTLSPDDMLRKIGSAGKPLFPAQLRIEEMGQELTNGQIGEIVVKGPNVTSGYYNREEANHKTIKQGWLYTGDLGYLDEEGFLYVVDRRSDLIISGGENIYPAEIEAVLLAHPNITEAGVVGIEDEKWGKVPVAFVCTTHRIEVSEQDIITFCRQRLANYKVPKQIHFTSGLPRNAANKLLRRKLLAAHSSDERKPKRSV